MRELIAAVPDVQTLLELEPEEVGSILLQLMLQRRERDPHFKPLLGNLTGELQVHAVNGGPRYPEERVGAAQQAMVEGWMWLERQGLLLPEPGHGGNQGWRILSRRAEQLSTSKDVERFVHAKSLPKHHLHRKLQGSAWSAFIRAEYDTAVFEAMKAVEVSIRDACPEIDRKEYGTALARKAFWVGPTPGPLTDTNLPPGEQENMGHLFAGALGTFKNAHSHRDVNLDDPQQARDTIGFASLLLTIIDARVAEKAAISK